MKKKDKLLKGGIMLLAFLFLFVYQQAQAQLLRCAPATLVATASGFNNAVGYNQMYVLVNSSGSVVTSNSTGTFLGVPAGNYTVHALNYDTNNPPTGVNTATNTIPAGTALASIGGGCMDNDFFTDYRSFSVTSCSCAANATFCSTDPVVGTMNNFNSFYTQTYFLTNGAGTILASNTTGNFGPRPMGIYRIYALNYNPSNPPQPLATATNVNQIGTTYTGCFNEDFFVDYMCVTVQNCTCTPTNVCLGSPIAPSMTGFNAAYSQWYVLVNQATGIMLEVTNQNPPSFNTNGLTVGGIYDVHALNFNPTNAPDPLPVIGQPLSSVGSTSAGCMNSDFFTDKKCFQIVDCCVPIDICQGRPITVGTTGQNNGATYVQTFILTDNNGVVLATSNTNPANFSTGNLTVGSNYRVYALNYLTTNPPNIIPIVVGTTDVDGIDGGCYDMTGSGSEPFKCYHITSATPSNPSAVTQAGPTTNTYPVCISPPTNQGQVFSTTVTNNCVPPLNIGINAREIGNALPSPTTGILTTNRTNSCGGTLNFNNAPIIYSLICSNDGNLNLSITPPANVSGTITNFEVALFGPLTNPLPCPFLSFATGGASFVDCNNNNGSAALALNYPTAQTGEVWLVLIDTDGGMGDFIISGAGIALPATALTLAGENQGKINHLVWTTAIEVNVHHFEVEKSVNSANNANFVKIAEKDALGNTSSPTTYTLDDTKPEIGANFYRVKAVDIDGQITQSNTIEINIGQLSNINVYPNPFKSELNIEINGGMGITEFKLYNAVGQIVKEAIWDVTSAQTYTLDVSRLASGTYFYRVVNNGATTKGKITKE